VRIADVFDGELAPREERVCQILGIGSIIGGGLGLIGSIFGGNSAKDAANINAKAAEQAAQLQAAEFQVTQQNLLPFLQEGVTSKNALDSLLGLNRAPDGSYLSGGVIPGGGPLLQNPQTSMGPAPNYNMPAFTSAMYQQSPGYNATLQGGTQALQNAGATKTGALSGNVLKALQGYGTGLANADYQQGYQNYATNYGNQFANNNANYWSTLGQKNLTNQNAFNWLQTLMGSGQNAAANLGALGSQTAGNIGQALVGAGAARSAGVLGQSQALTGGLNSLATMFSSPNTGGSGGISALLSSIFGGGGSGATDYGSQFMNSSGDFSGV
jgi:hypothetical protein